MFAANFFSIYTSMMLMCTVQGWILMTKFMESFWFCLHSLPEIVSENSVHYALQHEHEYHAWVSCERFSLHVVVIKLLYGGWFQSCSMQHQQPHRHKYIPYREKTFVNFKVLWLFAKVFSAKILFSTNSRKFSTEKVSHYMIARPR